MKPAFPKAEIILTSPFSRGDFPQSLLKEITDLVTDFAFDEHFDLIQFPLISVRDLEADNIHLAHSGRNKICSRLKSALHLKPMKRTGYGNQKTTHAIPGSEEFAAQRGRPGTTSTMRSFRAPLLPTPPASDHHPQTNTRHAAEPSFQQGRPCEQRGPLSLSFNRLPPSSVQPSGIRGTNYEYPKVSYSSTVSGNGIRPTQILSPALYPRSQYQPSAEQIINGTELQELVANVVVQVLQALPLPIISKTQLK